MMLFVTGLLRSKLNASEAVASLHKAKHHLGQEISHEEIKQGQLQDLLIADDYMAPSEVCKLKSCYYI